MMKTNSKRLGLYIHIPYCIRKCSYCDFLSFERSSMTEDEIGKYFEAVNKEVLFYGNLYQDYIVDTIFIGGGTPSCVCYEYISGILDTIRDKFKVTDDAEITIEANPGTLNKEILNQYVKAGINRLSIGAQSFDDDILKTLGRIHNTKDIYDSFKLAREAGFENINIDLMSAVPYLNMNKWEESLSEAVLLNPEHISFYSLQIEEGTPFYDAFERGEFKETSEDDDRKMYHHAVSYLEENGYYQYEISNAAPKGYESLHNMKYWSMDEYLGIGLGASSYIRPYSTLSGISYDKAGYGVRYSNTEDFNEYISTSGTKKEGFNICGCVASFRENTLFDDASEFVFTGLRRKAGISFKEFFDFTGKHFFDIFDECLKDKMNLWADDGFAVFDKVSDSYGDERDYIFRLTILGFDISNSIMMEFV